MENSRFKILAIDDNQDNLISLRALVADVFPQSTVFIANSGPKGLELAVRHLPDVIILDVVMPIMDGFEVCRALKADASLSEIPVVFLTAIKGDRDSRIRALECGAEAFLAKPIDESELSAQIKAMVRIREARLQRLDEKQRLSILVEEKTVELRSAHELTLSLLDGLRKENEARKLSEESLKESEAKFRHITENISDVVFLTDTTLKLTYISPSIEKLIGESADVQLMRTIEDNYPPQSLALMYSVLGREMENEKDPSYAKNRVLAFEVEHYRADKSLIWVSVHVSFIRDADGVFKGFQGVISDINDRKLAEIELKKTKDYLEKLFSFASAPIIVWNSKFEITSVNSAFEKITGKSAMEILGSKLSDYFPLGREAEMNGILGMLRSGLHLPSMEVEVPHVDGSSKTILWSSATVQDNQDFIVIAQGQDITQRLIAERNLVHLSFHDSLTNLYNRRFFEEELSRLDTERNLPISIIMGDINGLKLINDSFGHAVGDDLLKKTAESLLKYFREDDIVARLGGDEFVILLPKTDTPEVERIIQRISAETLKERVMNIELSISFGYDTKRTKEEDIQMTLKKAEDSMYRLKLYENKSLRSKTIDVIMNALIEKSNRELMHSRRVSSLCERIAMELELKTEYVNQIRIAGLVHDIGKIGIDEKILNKPTTLDPDEWEAIKKHPEAGWRILNSVNEFSELSEFVLCHHERWDGKGYPRGLKGETIPLEARIIMIADSYDAMTSLRSYRKPFDDVEASNELLNCAGAQFDPAITRVFVEKVLGKPWILP